MVVDTSALMAILLGEAERPVFETIILSAPAAVMSVVGVVETTIALCGKRRDAEAARLDGLLADFGIEVSSVDPVQGAWARQAFVRYGRGRHPAALNFGDCFSYALAKSLDIPLLFKGDDFSRTDIVPAWRP
ncbi:type II toxin-antitoxin system VapC family toxin [Rhodoplanes sp. TEM]|uniref:Ribonuclease VapC n=1 Tax=Rhodoplanes tepidamans TaxID=200616 RepID=A0ABT5JJF5_RHOTP|nr:MULTISPECIES: type II toxin-antitoxin system VapC family toxin [Rhodoplanes]MDC7789140.1 type II toxin-antitoxin system VapC family toxin [Rhodoplanes tepidamans]MDC7987646.1 type II toxin-antitoxin system VapC family toxin [Rhodoplanes sp. TEM]